jgi:hypothetical protein
MTHSAENFNPELDLVFERDIDIALDQLIAYMKQLG